MDVQNTEPGLLDSAEEDTASQEPLVLARPVTKDGNDRESHEPCGTRFLFTPFNWFFAEGGETTTTVPKLRLGIAAACHSCRIVLDALTSYSNGRIPIDNIVDVKLASADREIRVRYRPVPIARGDSGQSRVRTVKLELFRLKGM